MADIDEYTKLLLHCDGADESTDFPDSSDSGHTVTANGDAQIDTAQSKFGGASALFVNSIFPCTDYLTIPDSADWNFGTGNFTIDFWVRAATQDDRAFMSANPGTTPYWWILYYQGTIGFWADGGGTAAQFTVSSSTGFTTDVWTHIAVVRNGGTITLYKDGVSIGSNANPGADAFPYSNAGLYIGIRQYDLGYGWQGHLDEIRVSKGIARWTANFTPPTSAYGLAAGGGLGIGNPYIF